jgi:hypothetical protein
VQVRVELDPARKSPMHVTILCVSEDRTVELLYPREIGVRDNLVEPGVPFLWPIKVFETPIDGLGRPERDRILVLATQQVADFSQFVARSAPLEPPATRGAGERLPDALLDALTPCRTRGATATAPGVDEPFGVAALDMEVVAARRE